MWNVQGSTYFNKRFLIYSFSINIDIEESNLSLLKFVMVSIEFSDSFPLNYDIICIEMFHKFLNMDFEVCFSENFVPVIVLPMQFKSSAADSIFTGACEFIMNDCNTASIKFIAHYESFACMYCS